MRDSTGKWMKGASGNPKGRPRKGNALAEAIRAKVDPYEQVERILHIAKTADSDQVRLMAEAWLADRGYSKPVQRTEVGMIGDSEALDGLSVEELEERVAERRAALKRHEAYRAALMPSNNPDDLPGVIEATFTETAEKGVKKSK